MEKQNTKGEIIKAALELFSVQGFEATSISQIAEAVGIRKASLYSHFSCKQEILDCLTAQILERYAAHSVLTVDVCNYTGSDPDSVVRLICEQVKYILHDPYVSRARRMLTIEQFQNPELAKLQTKQNYTDVMSFAESLLKKLVAGGKLIDRDTQIMAAQFALPVSVWINLCDREPEREAEIMELIERHIRLFFELYRKEQ